MNFLTIISSFTLAAVLSVLTTSCVTTDQAPPKPKMHGTRVAWFGGTVEQAFQNAESNDKPVFLYWGASWCPPCNELKHMVFSRSQANEALAPFVPVYLDGDEENAQVWADKLQVSGYPTILVLLPNRKEVLRVTTALDMQDFRKVLQNALLTQRPFEETVRLALNGRARAADWQTLAYYNWTDSKTATLPMHELMQVHKQLTDLCPRHYRKEKALLSASLLAVMSKPKATDTAEIKRVRETVRSQLTRYLNAVLANRETILASRDLILYEIDPVLTWGFSNPSLRRPWAKKWLKAADMISNDRRISLDDRLWTAYPHMQWYKIENPGKTTPASILNRLERTVRSVDKIARDGFERTSVITGASYLLREAGEASKARRMLIRELRRTKYPWYVTSSLASLEEKSGNPQASLRWSKQARLQAKGRASKLQWAASDLLRQVRMDKTAREVDLFAALNDLYNTAFKLDDGFSGRNAKRMRAVADSLSGVKNNDRLRIQIEQQRSRCAGMSATAGSACRQHFSSILSRQQRF